MVSVYTYNKELDCCGGGEVKVRRVILRDLDDAIPSGLIRHSRITSEKIADYKALSLRNGNTRQYDINVTTKAGFIRSGSTLGQAAQALGSMAMPGNSSRFRSPLRSAGWRAITPGMPGGRGIRGRNRASRCPEGYQYGGRFTDNELSTCGAKLFGIPSLLGAIIGEIRNLADGRVGENDGVRGRVIEAGDQGPDVLQRRRPQIPRVGNDNRKAKAANTSKVIEAMAGTEAGTARMVRRDGFQLEPVVSPAVLRTIPDNRDMEGATYLMSLRSIADLGNEELGLLSNTGITNITYVLSDGSSLSIQKVRALTVGERRKLGRTVNAAMKKDNSKDPVARLKYVSEETGDGIAFKQNLKNKKTPIAKAIKAKPSKSATQKATTPIGELIGSVDAAVAHINDGGSLADIDPMILQEVLKTANAFKKAKGGLLLTGDNGKYVSKTPTSDYEHLAVAIAGQIQNHLGLKTPEVAFVGEGGKRRQYLLGTPEGTIRGGSIDRDKTINDLTPKEVAAMLITDLATATPDRETSNAPIVNGTPVPTLSPSGLTDLDKIRIADRTKESIKKMHPSTSANIYNAYYAELRESQRKAFRVQLMALVKQARSFNFTKYRKRLLRDGEFSENEKIHFNIVQTIVTARIRTISASVDALLEILGS
jgi:hypothetical protein